MMTIWPMPHAVGADTGIAKLGAGCVNLAIGPSCLQSGAPGPGRRRNALSSESCRFRFRLAAARQHQSGCGGSPHTLSGPLLNPLPARLVSVREMSNSA